MMARRLESLLRRGTTGASVSTTIVRLIELLIRALNRASGVACTVCHQAKHCEGKNRLHAANRKDPVDCHCTDLEDERVSEGVFVNV